MSKYNFPARSIHGTIMWAGFGPLVRWARGYLIIKDLNPELTTTWKMSRWELFRFGVAMIWRSMK